MRFEDKRRHLKERQDDLFKQSGMTTICPSANASGCTAAPSRSIKPTPALTTHKNVSSIQSDGLEVRRCTRGLLGLGLRR